ncbi:MAG: hypothetical protein ACRD21_10700 [Vicinamibacteria bacterium]
MPRDKEKKRVAEFLLGGLLLAATPALSQPSMPRHLNKAIQKLEAGEVVFGSFASDKSPSGGAFYGGAPIDFVIYDMEHGPLDFVGFRTFLQFMLDRRQIVEKGSLQPEVVPFIPLPFYGRERNHWLIKQALDAGAFGIVFLHVSNVEEARSIVSGARYLHPADALDAPRECGDTLRASPHATGGSPWRSMRPGPIPGLWTRTATFS